MHSDTKNENPAVAGFSFSDIVQGYCWMGRRNPFLVIP
jgi:hypothetical protein